MLERAAAHRAPPRHPDPTRGVLGLKRHDDGGNCLLGKPRRALLDPRNGLVLLVRHTRIVAERRAGPSGSVDAAPQLSGERIGGRIYMDPFRVAARSARAARARSCDESLDLDLTGSQPRDAP